MQLACREGISHCWNKYKQQNVDHYFPLLSHLFVLGNHANAKREIGSVNTKTFEKEVKLIFFLTYLKKTFFNHILF